VSGEAQTQVIETRIPGRLDRMPWARWHWLVVIGLGIGVEAAGKSLEDVARPLTAEEETEAPA
jgi:hypothetical protein